VATGAALRIAVSGPRRGGREGPAAVHAQMRIVRRGPVAWRFAPCAKHAWQRPTSWGLSLASFSTFLMASFRKRTQGPLQPLREPEKRRLRTPLFPGARHLLPVPRPPLPIAGPDAAHPAAFAFALALPRCSVPGASRLYAVAPRPAAPFASPSAPRPRLCPLRPAPLRPTQPQSQTNRRGMLPSAAVTQLPSVRSCRTRRLPVPPARARARARARMQPHSRGEHTVVTPGPLF
jgi:hypothetical protein